MKALHSPFLRNTYEMLSQTLSQATAACYVEWMRRYILFHHFQELDAMRRDAQKLLQAFLLHLACDRNVSARTQNQALAAIMTLYRDVLVEPLNIRHKSLKAKQPRNLPEALHPEEYALVREYLTGAGRLAADLMFGSGLKVGECAALRCVDVDFQGGTLNVGDHWTILPDALYGPLKRRMAFVKGCYRLKGMRDNNQYFVFPAQKLFDPDTDLGENDHIHRNTIQKAVELAAQKARARQDSPLLKQGHCQSLRDGFAVNSLRQGYTIRHVQEFLGQNDLRQTVKYLSFLPLGKLL